ncbi:unnamed protein product [Prorocentrum cordatum]|uniref:Pentatricopeptide repeat-containing protein, chloroplastic n=1 Tax=Prorocentrum cordatum TaxID=2364126 RepID=A0ABN9T916_9DINO|nr:unnamed protein product [Polarella glacialis]
MAVGSFAAPRDVGGEAEAQHHPSSATMLGSARAIRASSGSGLWRCLASCGGRSWSPTSSIYSAGVSACDQGEQWQRALALISEMRLANIEPDEITLNAGTTACARGEQWQQALSLLSEMWEAKLEPTVFSCCVGVNACALGEQWQRALTLLSEGRRM